MVYNYKVNQQDLENLIYYTQKLHMQFNSIQIQKEPLPEQVAQERNDIKNQIETHQAKIQQMSSNQQYYEQQIILVQKVIETKKAETGQNGQKQEGMENAEKATPGVNDGQASLTGGAARPQTTDEMNNYYMQMQQYNQQQQMAQDKNGGQYLMPENQQAQAQMMTPYNTQLDYMNDQMAQKHGETDQNQGKMK